MTQLVSTSIPAPFRQRQRNGAGGIGEIAKQPMSLTVPRPHAAGLRLDLDRDHLRRDDLPDNESPVTSSSMVSRGLLNVRPRMEAGSERVLATRSEPWVES